MKKPVLVIIPLLIILGFVSLPSSFVFADSTSMGGQVEILPGTDATSYLTTTGKVSSSATATDSSGAPLSVTEGGAFSLDVFDWTGKVVLPISLSSGSTLDSFSDPAIGLVLTKTNFSLVMKDTDGIKIGTIYGDIVAVDPAGVNTDVTAKNIILKSEDFPLDLTSTDPKIGQVSASFQVNLIALHKNSSMHQPSAIDVSVSKDPDSDSYNAFRNVAWDENSKIVDVACTLTIKKTSLVNGADLGEATITMKAGKVWVEKYGIANVSILRYSEEGETQKLVTNFLGFEGDQGLFQAVSPGGLSVFSLAGIEKNKQGISWTIVVISSAGASLLVGIWFFIVWRRRKKKEKALKNKWPTGLNPGDWKIVQQ